LSELSWTAFVEADDAKCIEARVLALLRPLDLWNTGTPSVVADHEAHGGLDRRRNGRRPDRISRCVIPTPLPVNRKGPI
jgi:hypothetical protein